MPDLAPDLIDGYDAVILDLDGVVYLGADPVPGVPQAIESLTRRGVRVAYVTNNAARSPADVVAHLNTLEIPAEESDVITAAQAGAAVLAQRYANRARVLALGAAGVRTALQDVGLVPVARAEEQPVAVLQGFDPGLTWDRLTEAALAIQQGAEWVATNTDPTRPTERGLEPGNGAAVAALRTAVGHDPEIAGKPSTPLLTEAIQRLEACHPIVIGDRLDTDIAGAAAISADSMLVLTGAHGPADVFAASGTQRPTHIGWSVADLLRSPTDPGVGVHSTDGQLRLSHPAGELNRGEVAAATEQAARICWRQHDAGHPLNREPVAGELSATIARLQ